MAKNIKVTKETKTGLNVKFFNPKTKSTINRGEFVKQINNGQHPDYHVMHRDHKNIPRSNPDKSQNNNLD